MAPRGQQRTGSDMSAFGGQKPQKTGAADDLETGSDGIRDDDSAGTGRASDPHETAGGDGDQGQQEKREEQAPKGPPSDDVRNRIFARMRAAREEESGEGDGAGADGGAAGGDKGQGDEGDGDSQNASALDLEVDGKKVRKTFEEIAELADLSVDEVKAKPEFATRLAQRELASQDRLERAKQKLRETRSRDTLDDEVDPPRRPAQNQGGNDGSGSDDPDRQRDTRNTNGLEEEAHKLVEDIQIGDPKEAAGKLTQFLEKLVSTKVSHETEESRRHSKLMDDISKTKAALSEFANAHDELKGKKYAAPAIAAALHDEYREDLRKAMIAEGTDPDQVDEDLKAAPPELIARAHQSRRIKGDPNVRTVDRAFIETAYKRVSSEFGGNAGKNEQALLSERNARKENLRPQPKRSSVPPAHRGQQQQPADQTSVRKTAVQQMQRLRGQKAR